MTEQTEADWAFRAVQAEKKLAEAKQRLRMYWTMISTVSSKLDRFEELFFANPLDNPGEFAAWAKDTLTYNVALECGLLLDGFRNITFDLSDEEAEAAKERLCWNEIKPDGLRQKMEEQAKDGLKSQLALFDQYAAENNLVSVDEAFNRKVEDLIKKVLEAMETEKNKSVTVTEV